MTKFISLANDNPNVRLESFAQVEEAILRLGGTYNDMPLFDASQISGNATRIYSILLAISLMQLSESVIS